MSRRIYTGILTRDEQKSASIAGMDFQLCRVERARRAGPMTVRKQNAGRIADDWRLLRF